MESGGAKGAGTVADAEAAIDQWLQVFGLQPAVDRAEQLPDQIHPDVHLGRRHGRAVLGLELIGHQHLSDRLLKLVGKHLGQLEVRAGLQRLHAVDRVRDDDLLRADLHGARVEHAVVLGDPHAGDCQVGAASSMRFSSLSIFTSGSASKTGPTP